MNTQPTPTPSPPRSPKTAGQTTCDRCSQAFAPDQLFEHEDQLDAANPYPAISVLCSPCLDIIEEMKAAYLRQDEDEDDCEED